MSSEFEKKILSRLNTLEQTVTTQGRTLATQGRTLATQGRTITYLQSQIVKQGGIITGLRTKIKTQENDISNLKKGITFLRGGWATAKGDIAKLKIRLVHRDDLQSIMKKGHPERARKVQNVFPMTANYFKRPIGGGRSKLGERKNHLHKTVGHDLIKQPGERNRIIKWMNNAAKGSEKKRVGDSNLTSPVTSIGSMKHNNVLMKTFGPIRTIREKNPQWNNNNASEWERSVKSSGSVNQGTPRAKPFNKFIQIKQSSPRSMGSSQSPRGPVRSNGRKSHGRFG